MMDKPLESRQWGQSKRYSLLNRYGASWREALGFACLLAWLVPLQAADNVLRNIDFAALPGSSVQITLEAAQPIAAQPKIFTTDNPPRIAIDFLGMTSGLAQKTVPIEVGMARSVTAIEAGGRTRVVVNLVKQTGNKIQVEDNKVIITLAGSADSAAKTAQAASSQTPAINQRTTARVT
ncbi:MAG TPA: AMIN domain-containing protein, partial [Gammaproteobacteria bacterium]|nr:AMIN domain-containing protein [Gammaproteobacteria bacterium]